MVRIISFLFALLLSSAVVGQSPPGWPPPAYSIERQWKNIRDYGATDDTAVSDYNAFSSAIAALSDSGGVVYVPPGRYRLDSTLEITNSNFTIKGSPGSYIYCMIEAQNSWCRNGIVLDSVSNVLIDGLVLIGDADSNALVANVQTRANGIFLKSCDRVVIRNCEVTHFEYGIRVGGDPNDAGGGQSENCVVENCQVWGNQRDGIILNNASRNNIRFNHCFNNGLLNYAADTTYSTLFNANSGDVGSGIALRQFAFGGNEDTSWYNNLYGNICENNRGQGIILWLDASTTEPIMYSWIVNNTTRENRGSGIMVARSIGTNISGNLAYNNNRPNNWLYNIFEEQTYGGAGIQVEISSHRTVIDGNTCFETKVWDTAAPDNVMQYAGIQIGDGSPKADSLSESTTEPASDSCVITNNILWNHKRYQLGQIDSSGGADFYTHRQIDGLVVNGIGGTDTLWRTDIYLYRDGRDNIAIDSFAYVSASVHDNQYFTTAYDLSRRSDAGSIMGYPISSQAPTAGYVVKYDAVNDSAIWAADETAAPGSGTSDTVFFITITNDTLSNVNNWIKVDDGAGIKLVREDSTTFDVIRIVLDTTVINYLRNTGDTVSGTGKIWDFQNNAIVVASSGSITSNGILAVGAGALFQIDAESFSDLTGPGLSDSSYTLNVQVDASTIEISSNKLQVKNAGIALANLAANSVDSTKVVDGSLSGADLHDSTVTTDKILNGTILFEDWSQNAATTGQIPKWNGSVWGAADDDADVSWTASGDSALIWVVDTDTLYLIHLGDGLFQFGKVGLSQADSIEVSALIRFVGADTVLLTYDILDSIYNQLGRFDSVSISDSAFVVDDSSVTPQKIAENAIMLSHINDNGASTGYVIKFDGTDWTVGPDLTGALSPGTVEPHHMMWDGGSAPEQDRIVVIDVDGTDTTFDDRTVAGIGAAAATHTHTDLLKNTADTTTFLYFSDSAHFAGGMYLKTLETFWFPTGAILNIGGDALTDLKGYGLTTVSNALTVDTGVVSTKSHAENYADSAVAAIPAAWVWSDSSSHGPDSVLYADSSAYAASAADVDTSGAMIAAALGDRLTADPDSADLNSAEFNEMVADRVGGMVTGNTETNITVTYQDDDNTFDFEVASPWVWSDSSSFGPDSVLFADSANHADSAIGAERATTAEDVDTTGTDIAAALAHRSDSIANHKEIIDKLTADSTTWTDAADTVAAWDNGALNAENIDSTDSYSFAGAYKVTTAEADSAFMTKGYIDDAAGLINPFFYGDFTFVGNMNQWGVGHRMDTAHAHANHADTNIWFPTLYSGWDVDDTATCIGDSSLDHSHALHPGMLYMPEGYAGYKFWMAYTPICISETDENPHIAVSKDGQNWTDSIFSNPLFVPSDFNCLHLSDPDLFPDDAGGLWMAFRASWSVAGTDTSAVFVVPTTDGATWNVSDSVRIMSRGLVGDGVSHSLMSPSIILDTSGTYSMWVADHNTEASGDTTFIILFTAPKPDSGWAMVDTCTVTGLSDTTKVWHLEVLANGADELVGLFTVCHLDSAGSDGRLHLAISNDRGRSWTVQTEPVLDGDDVAETAWDFSRIYRSSGYWIDNSHGKEIGLYYSAYGANGWGTGYTTITFDGGIEPGDADTTGASLTTYVANYVDDHSYGNNDDTVIVTITADLIHGHGIRPPGDSVWMSFEGFKCADTVYPYMAHDTGVGTSNQVDTFMVSWSCLPEGTIGVDSIFFTYRTSSVAATTSYISPKSLYGPKSASFMADSVYAALSTSALSSLTWAMGSESVNTAASARNQVAALMTVLVDNGEWVEIGRAYLTCKVVR